MSEERAIMVEALKLFIYETTHLSPTEDDGSHWCKISAETLRKGRDAIAAANCGAIHTALTELGYKRAI